MAKRKAAVPKDDAGDGDVAAAAPAPGGQRLYRQEHRPKPRVQFILLRLANRHGLVTGATGTGKTVTLQGLAEGFSDQGVPVFCADVKGDLSGVVEAGEMKPWIEARDKAIGFTQNFQAYPVIFWDLFGEQGPADPRDDFLARAASSVPPDGSERGARGRAQYRLQDRRRRKASAHQSQGLAGSAAEFGESRRRSHDAIRQHHQGVGRLDPAFAAGAPTARRRTFLRRAGAQNK